MPANGLNMENHLDDSGSTVAQLFDMLQWSVMKSLLLVTLCYVTCFDERSVWILRLFLSME